MLWNEEPDVMKLTDGIMWSEIRENLPEEFLIEQKVKKEKYSLGKRYGEGKKNT